MILTHASVRSLLDFSRPIGIIMCAVLHFVTDDGAAQAAIAHLAPV